MTDSTYSTNGVPHEYSITLTQSAKGIITIDKLTITSDDEEKLLKKLRYILSDVVKGLSELNNLGVD